MNEEEQPNLTRSSLPEEASAEEFTAEGASGADPADFGESQGLGFVMDVPVRLSVEIGRKSMRIAEILRLGPGSILELNKANGEPLDVYANDRLVARGEAVVVGERYGVRLTEVMVHERSNGEDLEDFS